MGYLYEAGYNKVRGLSKDIRELYFEGTGRIWVGAAATGGALAVALALFGAEQRDGAEVMAAAQADGFVVAEKPKDIQALNSTAYIDLDIGACALEDVRAELVVEDGEVVDITGYVLDGTLGGEVHNPASIFRTGDTVIEGGTDVVLTFTNLRDLQSQTLGNDLCVSLAEDSFRPSYDR